VSHHTNFLSPTTTSRIDMTATAIHQGHTRHLWQAGITDAGRRFTATGWQIEADSDTACIVSNYCDWTNISDELRARFRWPVVPVDRLQRSVENLERSQHASSNSPLAAGLTAETGWLPFGLSLP
jgi:hypothetical protein